MLKYRITALMFVFSTTGSNYAVADSSCSASNELGDTCSISCSTGQSAACTNMPGGSPPKCECKGSLVLEKHFFEEKSETFVTQTVSIDALTQINTKLSGLRDYHLSDSCITTKVGQECTEDGYGCFADDITGARCPPFLHRRCEPIYKTTCTPVVGKLTATSVRVIDSSVVAEEPNWSAIPSSLFGWREQYRNCTSVSQQGKFNFSDKVATGAKVTNTQTVVTGQEVSVGLSFNFAPGAGATAGVKFNKNISIGESKEQSFQSDQTVSFEAPVLIPAMTLINFQRIWTKRVVPVKFTGKVVVDAVLKENKEGIIALSQVLTNAVDRTFSFSGVVEDAEVFSGSSDFTSKKLKATDCPTPIFTEEGKRVNK